MARDAESGGDKVEVDVVVVPDVVLLYLQCLSVEPFLSSSSLTFSVFAT